MNRTLVVFKVAGQSYCTDILKIKEVCMKQDIVAMPNSPSFVEGISNLRGEVICIVNMADKLGVVSKSDNKNQKIIIISINNFSIGFSVDDISGIIHVSSEDIELTPDILSKSNVFSDGVVKTQDKIMILLDFNRILNEKEIEELENLNKDVSL
ncbi:CheW-like protein [[Eubacterium] yurii subsp. margaretiae ATCC 43715]|nr:CheW-like protein [[Eubacterium] yurii subsp. margaretiae ATCC 43715]